MELIEASKKRLASDTVQEESVEEVKGLRNESLALKEALAEIIQLVEQSNLPALQTLDHASIRKSAF